MLSDLIYASAPNPATFGARVQVKRQPRGSILKINLHNENQSTMKTQTDIGENPPKSNGVDVMQDVSRTQVWDIPRTGIHSDGRRIEIVEQKADKWMIRYLG